MATKRKSTTRLYLDVARKTYWTVPFSLAKTTIEVPVKVAQLKRAKKGYPWACWLAEAIKEHAAAHPREFPHPVKYAHVLPSVAWIVDRVRGTPTHAVKYKHNMGPVITKFDTMPKAAFMRLMNGDGDLVLKLKPGRKYRGGETPKGGNGSGGSRSITVARGAKRRAIAAGLIPAEAAE